MNTKKSVKKRQTKERMLQGDQPQYDGGQADGAEVDGADAIVKSGSQLEKDDLAIEGIRMLADYH